MRALIISPSPSHDQQIDEEGDERQAQTEDRVMVERDRQQRRRDDADEHAHEAHAISDKIHS